MPIRIIILFVILSLLGCSRINTQNSNSGKKNKYLENEYFKVVPSKGIFVFNDTLLIGGKLKSVVTFLNKYSLKYSLSFDEPGEITIASIDSPPPNIDGTFSDTWHQTPDEHCIDYAATIKVDSMTFRLCYSNKLGTILDKKAYTDSLKITSIKIGKPFKAKLFDNLKLGDPFEQIFEHFEKPNYCCQPGQTISKYKGNGVIFEVEDDKASADFGKIKSIEVNNISIN